MTMRDAVHNEIFILIARGAMVLVAGVGVPVAGWMLNRVFMSIDNVTQLSQVHTVQLDHIQTTVMDHVDYLTRAVGDHEQRIRTLEQKR